MLQDLWPWLLLCVTALLAGIINSLAGGGTLLTFPALIDTLNSGGFPNAEAMANATSTLALVPAALSSTWAYRKELAEVKHWLAVLLPPSLLGGALGSVLVVVYPDVFKSLVPWLILTASILFTLQPVVTKWLGHTATTTPSRQRVIVVVVAQFLVSLYGGYFGAGIGILMLSALGLMGMSNLHEMNALKVVLGASINGIAVAVFVVQDAFARYQGQPELIEWRFALAMMLAALVGGYVGAKYGRLLPAKYVRYFVIGIGFGLTTYYLFFAR